MDLHAIPGWSVITGGPGAGKSTLLRALAARDVITVPEVARAILKQPVGMVLRADNPSGFAVAMLDAQLAAMEALPTDGTRVIFDRGLCDIAGFLDLLGLPIPAELDQACRAMRYGGRIFHAAHWPAIYMQDDERIQTIEEAAESDRAIAAAWVRFGYDLVILPRTDPRARAQFVLEH